MYFGAANSTDDKIIIGKRIFYYVCVENKKLFHLGLFQPTSEKDS